MQLERLFETVFLLLEKKTVTAAELAERFEVSVRTIYRDIETLSAAGVPIYATRGKGGGISIMERYKLERSLVSPEEQLQILAALRSVGAAGAQDVEQLCAKLGGLFQQESADWLEVDFSGWGGGEREKQLFVELRDATLSKRAVAFTYSGADGQMSRRVVEPIKLVFKGQSWYLYAWCRAKSAERFFKLTRLRELAVLEEHFTRVVPPGPAGGQNVFEKQQSVDLVLHLEEPLAFRVYDEFTGWERQEDGGFVVTQRVPEGDWVYSWLLSFGDKCEVLSPLKVRAKLACMLRRALEHYQA